MKKDISDNILLFISVLFFISILCLMIYLSLYDTEYIRENDPYDYAKVGESIWNGSGISLNEKPYVLMPPGFPVIAGGLNEILNNPELSIKFSSILFWIITVFLLYLFLGYFFKEQSFCIIGVLLYVSNSVMIHSAAAGRVEPVFLSFLMLFAILLIQKSVMNKITKVSYLFITFLAVVASSMYYLRPEGLWIAGVLWMVFIFQIRMPVIKKTIFTVIYLAGISIMIFPYVFFLKSQTGQWQLSGKAYANLVMGEMDSPYQSGIYSENKIPYRYTIIERIINNPDEARTASDYFSESPNKLYERIFPNLKSLTISVWFSYSIIGSLLIVLGLMKIPIDRQMWIWGTISVLGLYLMFFILNRFVAMYQPFFLVMLIGGMWVVKEWIIKLLSDKWAEIFVFVLTGLLMVYQLRNIAI